MIIKNARWVFVQDVLRGRWWVSPPCPLPVVILLIPTLLRLLAHVWCCGLWLSSTLYLILELLCNLYVYVCWLMCICMCLCDHSVHIGQNCQVWWVMTETLDCNTIVDIRSGIAEGIRATGTSTLRPLVVTITASTSILQLLVYLASTY